MKRKKNENFLDYTPSIVEGLDWNDNGESIVVQLKHTGFYNRIAQKFLGMPQASSISLDEYGSFVWRQLDGEKNVYQIGELVKRQYGSKAEPLYERLSQFIQTLYDTKFITYAPIRGGS